MQPVRIVLRVARNVFQVHGVDVDGNIVLRPRIRLVEVISFFAELPHCPVGAEACSASHHWPRMRSTQLGHDVRMMPARYVKAALGARRSDAGVGQAAIVLGRLKPAVRRLRRWPSARLDQAARRR